MSTMTSKDSSRQTHKLKADRTFKIFFQRRLNRRFFDLVGFQQMTNKVLVDFFVGKLTFPLDSFFAVFESANVIIFEINIVVVVFEIDIVVVVIIFQNNIVVQVAADVEVPLEVNFAVRVLRDDLFLVSKFFVNKFCNFWSVMLD
jgi:hypothetical protein